MTTTLRIKIAEIRGFDDNNPKEPRMLLNVFSISLEGYLHGLFYRLGCTMSLIENQISHKMALTKEVM